jgi:hypothetical protein
MRLYFTFTGSRKASQFFHWPDRTAYQLSAAVWTAPIKVSIRTFVAKCTFKRTDQFYGDRTYRARDPEGHIWTFGVTEKRMTPEEWDKESGLTTKKRLD